MELLVVIGIIAVLISVLLPALGAAREQARTAACASNLHQIGIALTAYSAQDPRGSLPPGDLLDSVKGTELGGWATILSDYKYTTAASQPDPNSYTSVGNTIFRCPSGTDMPAVWASPIVDIPGVTTSQGAASGGKGYWRFQSSDTGTVIDTWYGVNGSWITSDGPFPMNRWPSDNNDKNVLRITQLHRPTETVMVFDGWYMHCTNGNRMSVNARHARDSSVNFLFADSHVELIDVKHQWTTAQLTVEKTMVSMPYPNWKWQ